MTAEIEGVLVLRLDFDIGRTVWRRGYGDTGIRGTMKILWYTSTVSSGSNPRTAFGGLADTIRFMSTSHSAKLLLMSNRHS